MLTFNHLNTNPTKWSNTLKTIRLQKPTNCSSVFYHFVGLAVKGLIVSRKKSNVNGHIITINFLLEINLTYLQIHLTCLLYSALPKLRIAKCCVYVVFNVNN